MFLGRNMYRWSGTSTPTNFSIPLDHKLRLFAGQPDPSDAASFVALFEAGEIRGRIMGRLADDDSVNLVAQFERP